ncbi:MAG: alpha-amylase [Anaerolineae bacterium]|nr:MAG: alpha-amylase [Anaerolineae bacterium]
MMTESQTPLSRHARERYQVDNLRFDDLRRARRLARRMGVSAAELYALGLLDEALHALIRLHEKTHPGLFERAASYLDRSLGPAPMRVVQRRFESLFADAGEESPRRSGRRAHVVRALLLVRLHNDNPATSALRPLFDDSLLRADETYARLVESLEAFFRHESATRASGEETLLDVLRAPARVAPHSLIGQLEYVARRWGEQLGEDFLERLLRGVDFLKEEIRRVGTGGAAGPAPVLTFDEDESAARYSPDREWMPRLILLAKNTYVWLAQLTRRYGREISRLDQIPDEELDRLAARGFTGLWLIGVWERSRASQRIKQMTGDPEAIASAYAIYDYAIAEDLGGWEALENLRARAMQRGIRLAADMVPNHMAIDSRWVIEHPERFLSLSEPPYPSYTFNGPDLCDDPRVGIYLEDHYYDRTDAAVVFQRRDYQTGDVRYIYHGNDGTSMPWNDTAQLDYLKPEVREAVIQTILHVARHFPIIRFDAAMTLAKRHIRRLWYPAPGEGGAIPSRAERGMSRSAFEAAMPREFWREVVERVAAEVPDTLLLAEAFWLMEGYFVRTLGMHRVYNSAFMHMLRDEENANYRSVMKNVLEFDPQVLKRFVNFMSNPDEASAAEQFGTTEKYFGVCTLMVTLPGLPMFGHGQIEGFREKYGMDFRRPRWDERVDEALVRGHERFIFPLLRRRALFADVEHFYLYDFFTPEGRVDENVFAFSNRLGEARALVLYHNRYAGTRGWVRESVAYRETDGSLARKSLGEGLGLPREGYVVFRDHVTDLEYIRPCGEMWEKGLYAELGPYGRHVFLDFRFVEGETWEAVCEALDGAGVPSVEAARASLLAGRREEKEEDVGVEEEEPPAPVKPQINTDKHG